SKGGPGITRSDLLVINKIDLAPHVGASLAVMERDARRMRGTRPFVFSNLRAGEGVDTIARFIEEKGGLERKGEQNWAAVAARLSTTRERFCSPYSSSISTFKYSSTAARCLG